MSESLQEKWKRYADYINEYGDDCLNDWEADFMESITEHLEFGEELSFKQSSVLSRIYHKVEERRG